MTSTTRLLSRTSPLLPFVAITELFNEPLSSHYYRTFQDPRRLPPGEIAISRAIITCGRGNESERNAILPACRGKGTKERQSKRNVSRLCSRLASGRRGGKSGGHGVPCRGRYTEPRARAKRLARRRPGRPSCRQPRRRYWHPDVRRTLDRRPRSRHSTTGTPNPSDTPKCPPTEIYGYCVSSIGPDGRPDVLAYAHNEKLVSTRQSLSYA